MYSFNLITFMCNKKKYFVFSKMRQKQSFFIFYFLFLFILSNGNFVVPEEYLMLKKKKPRLLN